jgi:hypothetical protein
MDARLSFASLDFASKKKRTKRDVFLADMAAVVPWPMLEAIIEPYYPKIGAQGGRRPFPIAVMLHLLVAAMVFSVRSGCGGSAVRHSINARVLPCLAGKRSLTRQRS